MKLFDRAEWIWLEDIEKVNAYATFIDTVSADPAAGRCTLYISVDTNYALYINGELNEFGQFADYPFDKVYDVLDITAALKAGENEVEIRCWHQGDDSSTIRGETAGLIYVLTQEKDTGSGEYAILAASSTALGGYADTRYTMGAGVEKVSGQLGYSFRCDDRIDPRANTRKVIQTDKAKPVRARPIKKLIVGDDEPVLLTVNGGFTEAKAGGTLGQRMQYAALAYGGISHTRRLPSERGVKLTAPEDSQGIFALIDTGRENAGVLSLDIELENDCEILVGWGEHLEDMRVRAYVGGRNFCASYHARAGRNRFIHTFRRLGMRYMQIHIYAKSANIFYAGIRTTDYPLESEKAFSCADSLHTKIDEVSRRTLLMCMHEHYEDCPWREQALYSMDSRNQMLCGYYAFDEYDFPKASIRLMAQSLRDDGMLELCSPARVAITIPSFTAIFLTQAAEYLQYSGDVDFLREIFPALETIAQGFMRRLGNRQGLLTCYAEPQYWNFYEWQTGLSGSISGSVPPEKMAFDAPLCAFVSMGFNSLGNICAALGEYEKAQTYVDAHFALNEAINRYFWDADKGAYASYIRGAGVPLPTAEDAELERFHYAELTNALIVCCGAAGEHEGRERRVLKALKDETLIPVTLSHSIFKYEALMQEPEQYARYVFGDIAGKWGHMLSNNATTFWETIDGALAFGDAGSLCHAWSAIPIYFYHEYAAKLGGEITGLYECGISDK